MTVFSENLRKIRIQKGKRQGGLAKDAGITQAALSQFENAIRAPTPAMLQKLSEALEVEPSELTEANIDISVDREILLINMNRLSPNNLNILAKFSEFLVTNC